MSTQVTIRCDRLPSVAIGRDEQWQRAAAIRMADQMQRCGWRPVAARVPGEIRLTKDDLSVDLARRFRELARGELDTWVWQSGCVEIGVAEAEIAIPELPTVPAAPAFVNPVPEPKEQKSLLQRPIPGWFALVVVGAVVVVVAAFLLVPVVRQFIAHCQECAFVAKNPDYRKSTRWADGESNLPGGALKLAYVPSGQDWEAVVPANGVFDPNDRSAWWIFQKLDRGVAKFGLTVIPSGGGPGPDDLQQAGEQLVALRRSEKPDRGSVAGESTRVGDRPAYEVSYREGENGWTTEAMVISERWVFQFVCTVDVASARELAAMKERCGGLWSVVKFADNA